MSFIYYIYIYTLLLYAISITTVAKCKITDAKSWSVSIIWSKISKHIYIHDFFLKCVSKSLKIISKKNSHHLNMKISIFNNNKNNNCTEQNNNNSSQGNKREKENVNRYAEWMDAINHLLSLKLWFYKTIIFELFLFLLPALTL